MMASTPAKLLRASSCASLARSLSTATDGGYSFVKARAEYRQEVALLRKDFIVEEQRRKEKLARDAEAQRQKIMKEKAARLAIKRQQQAIRAAEVAEEKARHEALVRQRFEEKKLVREAREAEAARRRLAVVAELKQQRAAWTTVANIDEKLKEDVFIYSPQQISARRSFDASVSAVSWLEKLQRMKPAGHTASEGDEAAASAVAAAADGRPKPEDE